MSEQLFKEITCLDNLKSAWDKVRTSHGAPGVDKVSIEDFQVNLNSNLSILESDLLNNTYQPLELKTFTIKKDNGKERILHIPTVRDRVIAQAIVIVLTPIYEKIFHNCSYAYRPNLSAQKAIARVERNLKKGRKHVLNLDIASFFDNVDRQLLETILAEQIKEKRVIQLIRLLVDAYKVEKGIAQGLPLSPLLSNIYLHQLDDRLVRASWNYVRYSDNILVLDDSRQGIDKAFEWIKEELQKLKITFNEEKTELTTEKEGFSFLGFRFDEKGKQPDRPAISRLNTRVGNLLTRAFEYSEKEMKTKIDAILRGWLNYFNLTMNDNNDILDSLDEHLPDDENQITKIIIKACAAILVGNYEKSKEFVLSADTSKIQNSQLYFQWGVLCEMLGLQNEAFDSFLTAYRLNSDDAETSFQIGLFYLKRNQHEQAIRYLQKAVQIDPDKALYHFTLGTALQNFSLGGAAQKALKKAYAIDPKLQQEKKTSTKQTDEYSKPTIKDLEMIVDLFSGREGVYAKQWMNDSGKMGYSTIHEPFSTSIVEKHLSGKETCGLYIMRSDNTVNHLVFDIDVTRQVRADVLNSDDDLEHWRQFVLSDAQQIQTALKNCGITSYLEDSGFKGIHVWVFFGDPQPARRVIDFSKKILSMVGAPPTGVHRDVFPNQPRINPNALGSLIKIPMGIHKATVRRCCLLNETGKPIDEPFAFLYQIVKMNSVKFVDAIEKSKSSNKLDADKLDADKVAQVEKIFEKCNILAYLEQKAEREKRLAHMDRMTLLCVLGYMGQEGRHKLHEIIGKTLNYNYRITDKWVQRLKGYPVSCPKIRVWQSDVTPAVGCACKFEDKPGNYPSPLLYTDPLFILKYKKNHEKKNTDSQPKKQAKQKDTPPKPEQQPEKKAEPKQNTQSPVANEHIGTVVKDYIATLKKLRQLEEKSKTLIEQLDKYAEKQGTTVIKSKFGTLRKMNVDNTEKWMLEL